MRRLLAVLGVILALFPALSVSQGTQDKIYEAAFLSVPNAESAEGHLNALSSQPHVAGTIYGYNSAIYVRDKVCSLCKRYLRLMKNFPKNQFLWLENQGQGLNSRHFFRSYPSTACMETADVWSLGR